VVPNNGAIIPVAIKEAKRIRICPYPSDRPNTIGAIKRFACEKANGNIIVELDHDDLLTPNALGTIWEVFNSSKGIGFVYSDFAEFKDETWEPHIYNQDYGWAYRQEEFYGHDFVVIRGFPPTAASLSVVHYAPNHVRAWTKKAYWDVGRHDPEMRVCDDHDLVCRFYLNNYMYHIPECLYLYRITGENSYLKRNKEVRETTYKVRDKYLWKLVERWAQLQNLCKVDLGSAHNKPSGYIGVDQYDGPGVDEVCDVSKGLPFEDSSVGVVRACDFLEHAPNPVFIMNEIYRVLVDGGWLISATPSTDGRGAWQDPTHVSFWNQNSFWYYTDRGYAKYVPDIKCRFQIMRLGTWAANDFQRRNDIKYVYADLVAIKSDRRRPGLIKI